MKKNIPHEILETYRSLSKKMYGKESEFPLGTTPLDSGRRHLELSDDGKMALIGTQRGQESKRLETYSLDQLMYWIFEDHASATAFRSSSYYNEDISHEEAQQIALDEIGKISAEWRERLRKEQDVLAKWDEDSRKEREVSEAEKLEWQKNIPEKILKTYHSLSKKMYGKEKGFPLRTTPVDSGGKYLELSDDGKMALIGNYKGRETERRETYSLDQLMYWIFKRDVFDEAYGSADRSSEETQQFILDEMGKISAEWRERLRKDEEVAVDWREGLRDDEEAIEAEKLESQKNIPDEVLKTYRSLSKKMHGKARKFPLGTIPFNSGDRSFNTGEEKVQFSDDGRVALNSGEGVLKRRETYSLDELMYWMFRDEACEKAFLYAPDRSFEESQQIALDEIGKVSAEWRESLRKEQEVSQEVFAKWCESLRKEQEVSEAEKLERQKNIPNEILETYRSLSKKMYGEAREFPLGTTPVNSEGEHLEFLDDGRMALSTTSFGGGESKRRETYSLDELMYWIFEDDVAYAKDFNDNPDRSFEESQQISLDEMGRVSAEWRERLRKRQAEINGTYSVVTPSSSVAPKSGVCRFLKRLSRRS